MYVVLVYVFLPSNTCTHTYTLTRTHKYALTQAWYGMEEHGMRMEEHDSL